jgi:glycosyltransferase involved in cell wall biosynthesis
MKILFLSRWFPCPPNNGARIRRFNLLRGLSCENEVSLVSFTETGDDCSLDGLKLQDWKSVPWKGFDPHSLKGILGFFRRTPRSLIDTYSPQMESVIRRALARVSFDVIIASDITMASYGRLFGETAAILEELETGAYHQRLTEAGSHLEKIRYRLTWAKLGAYLRRVLPRFRHCTVVSEDERRLLGQLAPGYSDVEVVPNGVDLASYPFREDSRDPKSLVFCGSCDYGPNHQGISWFIERVYPLIKAREPEVSLKVTGNGLQLPTTPGSGVTQTGYVEDVKSLVYSSGVSVVPILSGGGTRLKILESMALGTPVVSTSKGAEGLQVTEGENLMIGDSPDSFAEAVLRLVENEHLRKEIAHKARRLVQENHDWSKIMDRFVTKVMRSDSIQRSAA